MHLTRRRLIQSLAATALIPLAPRIALAAGWGDTFTAAKGQEVYFNAWGGGDAINAYIGWAADEAQKRFGFKVTHVKLADTGEAVKRVRDEVAAGKKDGTVDLIWINGANFKTMKSEKLLFGPFAESLPNWQFVDVAGKPTVKQDFTESTDGLESPWGMAQLTFFADGATAKALPDSMKDVLSFAQANPGRVTYPAPPDFHGTTFVKQAMMEAVTDRALLANEVDAATFAAQVEKPLYDYLDALRPHLWRQGKQYPNTQAEMTQMLADGALMLGFTFNPNEAANLVSAGKLPATTTSWQFSGGTIGNTHFVAIPINAKAKEAAQAFADFLLSPEAQARKADLKVWGDPTVLDSAKLSGDAAKAFTPGAVPGSVSHPGPTLLEPHSAYVKLIEQSWLKHYGQG